MPIGKGAAMRLIFALIPLLTAAVAFAEDDYYYPNVVMSSTCTDTEDTPAGATLTALPSNRPVVQSSGSADGRCDHDSRISIGELSADATYGPLPGRPYKGYYVFVDATVTGTTFRLQTFVRKPHYGVLILMDAGTGSASGTDDYIWEVGITEAGYAPSETITIIESPLPGQWWLRVDLLSATAITADISMVPAF